MPATARTQVRWVLVMALSLSASVASVFPWMGKPSWLAKRGTLPRRENFPLPKERYLTTEY